MERVAAQMEAHPVHRLEDPEGVARMSKEIARLEEQVRKERGLERQGSRIFPDGFSPRMGRSILLGSWLSFFFFFFFFFHPSLSSPVFRSFSLCFLFSSLFSSLFVFMILFRFFFFVFFFAFFFFCKFSTFSTFFLFFFSVFFCFIIIAIIFSHSFFFLFLRFSVFFFFFLHLQPWSQDIGRTKPNQTENSVRGKKTGKTDRRKRTRSRYYSRKIWRSE